MDGRGKIRIPSEREMEIIASPPVKPMSLFQSYKQQKKVEEVQHKSTEKLVQPKAGSNQSGIIASNQTGSSGAKSLTAHTRPREVPVIKEKSQNTKAEEKANENINTVAASSSANVPGNVGTSSTGGKSGPSNSIIVNYRQRGNPILKHIRNTTWEYGSIVPDYVMGKANCALFLSLRYHQLNPAYIHNRLKELGKGYDLRVLLVQVDVKEAHHLLKDLAKICILADCTLILAFSAEEAGRYLEAYKVYENKPPDALMGKTDSDFISKLTDTLTAVKSVNKTDCMTLLSSFKSMEDIINASKEDLSLCPGFGPQKAQRLYDVFHEPFVKGRKRKSGNDKESVEASPQKTSR